MTGEHMSTDPLTPAQRAALEAVPLSYSVTIPAQQWANLSDGEQQGLETKGLAYTFYDGRAAIGKYSPLTSLTLLTDQQQSG